MCQLMIDDTFCSVFVWLMTIKERVVVLFLIGSAM